MMPITEAPDPRSKHLRQKVHKVTHAIRLGAGLAAAPVSVIALPPALGAAALAAELAFAVALAGIVIYGTREQADRTFRLLRWLRDRPEPPAPTSPPDN
jgi:uncharacterized membrane protein YfbV (UPF0208 family)